MKHRSPIIPTRARHVQHDASSRRAAAPESRKGQNGGSEEESSATSVEQVSTLLRQAIVQGRYGPGERIKVSEAAEYLGVSAMPVREALRKLEGEGIVSITPNRGATVRPVDRTFIEDIYEVRTTLELMVIDRCIAGMTLAKLKHLQELLAGHEKAADSGDIPASLETARAFNAALFEYAGNQEAERLFLRGWDTIHALRLRFGYSNERLQMMREEFRLLITALRRHDAEEARALIRMHNRAGMEDLLDKLAQSVPARKND